ncbi:MAG: hydrogenase maturation protease [Desulfobacteraceae bacterium]|nr:MAG: hydrogenase maturation protease [Desulfobacteraceae bacterium]
MAQHWVIGIGNPDRGDDGVARHVIDRLRAELGVAPLDESETGLGASGPGTALIFVRQLVPELVMDLGECDRMVFLDAHVPSEPREIVCTRIAPEARFASRLTHCLPPEGFLWLLAAAAGRRPESFLVSLRGECFDLARGLSPAAAGLVAPAAELVLSLIRPHADHRRWADQPKGGVRWHCSDP